MNGGRSGPELPDEVRLAIEALETRKARDLVILDLRGLCDATDCFIIASGTSDTHVRALADSVVDALRQQGHRPHHIEGLPGGRWVLLDYVDFVVHVFHPALREFYQLERLWADAPAVSTGEAR